MSIDRNKNLVREYFEAVNRGDENAILEMTTEDFVFRTMARGPAWLLPIWSRDEFCKVPATMSKMLVSPIQLKISDMTAEGERVSVESETESLMLTGKMYNNRYHFVFKIRDEKFYEILEYSCSYLAQTCFGAIEPSDPEATKAA